MNQFTDNKQQNRFELNVNGEIAFADYHRDNDTLTIKYVEAPVSLRGTGTASALMKHIANFAEQNDLKIIPICGYAASWLKRNKAL